MSFTKPKKPSPAPNMATLAKDTPVDAPDNPFGGPGSLITTSPSGLRRKAQVQRTSLIGG